MTSEKRSPDKQRASSSQADDLLGNWYRLAAEAQANRERLQREARERLERRAWVRARRSGHR